MYQLDFSVLNEYMPSFLDGLRMTVQISIFSIIFGTLFGIFGALCRISKSFLLRSIANIYIEWIRNTPLLIQILFIYFGLGVFFSLEPIIASIIALSFFSGAYITEIIRAGIQSVHKGQTEAALSIGMTESQAMLVA